MVTQAGQTAIYQGESTDQKPSNEPINTIFEELDTGKKYYYNGSTWAVIGG